VPSITGGVVYQGESMPVWKNVFSGVRSEFQVHERLLSEPDTAQSVSSEYSDGTSTLDLDSNVPEPSVLPYYPVLPSAPSSA
jgi:hypothetical protein